MRTLSILFLGGLLLSSAACDLTTEPPDFSVSPEFDIPLVTRQSFVLVGPDSTERTPLIDTTNAGTDSLFSVQPDDQSVLLKKEVAVLEEKTLARLFPPLSVGPGSLSISARRFLPKQLQAEFGDSIGVWTRPAVHTPLLPVEVRNSRAFAVAPDAPPINSQGPLLETDGDVVEGFRLTQEEDVNQYRFALRNELDVRLVSAEQSGAEPPELVIETGDGQEIARTRFSGVPTSGEVVTAPLSVAGRRLSRPLRFRLDATTPDGFSPIAERPRAVQVATTASPFRIVETTLQRISEQPSTRLSLPATSLEGKTGIQGIVIRDGQAEFTLQNRLPYPITITELALQNEGAVGEFEAGTRPFETGPIRVPPQTTRTTTVDLGHTAFASQFTPEVIVKGEGTDGPVDVRAADGLEIDLRLSIDLEALYLRPGGQQLRGSSRLPLRSRAIRFDAPDDFVTLEEGTLAFDRIRNEFPAALNPLQVRFPSFLRPSYGPSDSLVVQFGDGMASTTRSFPAIPAEGALRDQSLDLTGVRFELPSSSVPFSGLLRLASDPNVQAFAPDDRISVTSRVQNLRLRGVQADVEPLSALIPSDATADQALDLESDAEAHTFDASRFHRIGGTEVTALDLEDTRIRLALKTNVGVKAMLYLAVLGRRADGREAFLAGRGPYAVSEDDTTAHRLQRNGTPIAADNLLRIPLSGAPSPTETTTEVVELSPSTASLSEFLQLLPDEMRVIGRLVVQPDGGRVQLRRPVVFRLQFNLAQPLRVGGDVAFTQTIDANLEELRNLTTPTDGVSVEQFGLRVPYESGVPLATTLRLEALDEQDDVIARIPASETDSLHLASAPVSQDGIVQGTRSGTVQVAQSKAQIEQLSEGSALRIRIRLTSPPQREAVLRPTDGVSVRLEGAADIQVDGTSD